MPASPRSILALDVGTVRIGVAIANATARLPRPLITLVNDENFTEHLRDIIDNEGVDTVVIGLPRGLDGQETSQTAYVRTFRDRLQQLLPAKMPYQDEALSSNRAKTELISRGKPYQKGEVDALAATYILEDFLQTNEA